MTPSTTQQDRRTARIYGANAMGKILCIEDEEDLREDIVEELEAAGHDLLQAANGKQGLEMILEHRPDLVVSDITMPGMDGFAVLKEVRGNHPNLANMPFIFLSALADKNDQLEGLSLGADDYLTKPIDIELLISKVNAEVRRLQRIQEKTEQDYVRIYQAAAADLAKKSGQTAGASDQAETAATVAPATLSVCLVGTSSPDMGRLQTVLTKAGHRVSAFTSGRKFLDEERYKSAHAVFVWPTTSDITASELAPSLPTASCLRVLVSGGVLVGQKVEPSDIDYQLKLPMSDKELITTFLREGAKKFSRK